MLGCSRAASPGANPGAGGWRGDAPARMAAIQRVAEGAGGERREILVHLSDRQGWGGSPGTHETFDMPPARQRHPGLRGSQPVLSLRSPRARRGVRAWHGVLSSLRCERHRCGAGCHWVPRQETRQVVQNSFKPLCFHLILFNPCSYSFSPYLSHQHFPGWILTPPS